MEIEATAHHEAGHAVCALLTPGMADTLQAVRLDGSGGVTLYRPARPPEDPARDAPYLYAAMRAIAAGPVAGSIYTGRIDDDVLGQAPVGDQAKVRKIAAFLARVTSEEEAARTVQRAFAAAELLLGVHWGAVESVAEWLLSVGVLRAEHVRSAVSTAPEKHRAPTGARIAKLLVAADGDPDVSFGWEHLPRSMRLRMIGEKLDDLEARIRRAAARRRTHHGGESADPICSRASPNGTRTRHYAPASDRSRTDSRTSLIRCWAWFGSGSSASPHRIPHKQGHSAKPLPPRDLSRIQAQLA